MFFKLLLNAKSMTALMDIAFALMLADLHGVWRLYVCMYDDSPRGVTNENIIKKSTTCTFRIFLLKLTQNKLNYITIEW